MFREEIRLYIKINIWGKIGCNPMPLPQPMLTCYTLFSILRMFVKHVDSPKTGNKQIAVIK